MATVGTELSMSLDGFLANPDDGVEHIFDWYAWGNHHPLDVPVFIVTHDVPEGWPRDDVPFTFVTDGVAVAQASAVAGDNVVGVGAADVVQHCLNAGLLDEIVVNLALVLLGEGIPSSTTCRRRPCCSTAPR